ncbi:MAG: ABC transporter ATP-binding protein [Fimbriiglobus sp.]
MLVATDLYKTYKRNADQVKVLQGLTLEVHEGEFLSIVGASGSGKSTLVHLLGTLDSPDSGSITLRGQRIDNVRAKERDRLRNQVFGYIFQFYHLLPELSTLDNVLMPAYINHSFFGWQSHKREWKKRAEAIIDRVGLSHRLKHKPRELSGGEMQRTAVARALLCRPQVLLADEPTGNLDAETGGSIVKLLRDLNQQEGITIVMVTHNLDIAHTTHRIVKMALGKVVPERTATTPRPKLAAV